MEIRIHDINVCHFVRNVPETPSIQTLPNGETLSVSTNLDNGGHHKTVMLECSKAPTLQGRRIRRPHMERSIYLGPEGIGIQTIDPKRLVEIVIGREIGIPHSRRIERVA